MGGYVAASFAAQFPKYLQRLVMFHSSFQANDAEKASSPKAIDFMAKNGTKDFLLICLKIFSKDFSENNVDVISNFVKSPIFRPRIGYCCVPSDDTPRLDGCFANTDFSGDLSDGRRRYFYSAGQKRQRIVKFIVWRSIIL